MNELEPSSEIPWWKRKLVDLFAIDPRALAVFRIGIALVLLYDLIDRFFDFDAMVLDSGVMSVADAQAHGNDWSLYFFSSADWFQTLLFGLTFVTCIAMLFGCFTRVATICTWALVVSLQARLPIILNGGDSWMQLMLFWAIFLPLGRVWSLDARHDKRTFAERVRSPILSIATTAVLFQIAVVYFFAGLAKWNDVWLSGNAMYYVFDQLIFLRPLGKVLLEYPLILRVLCYSTLALEIGAPLLLFFPWATKHIRIVVVLLIYGLHLGIELTLNVGHFSYIAFASWTLFLPVMFWNSAWMQKVLPMRKSGKAAERNPSVALHVRFANWTASKLIKKDSLPHVREVSQRISLRCRTLVAVFCACCLIFMLVWNISWIAGDTVGRSVRSATRGFGTTVGLTQKWRMFGIPFNVDTWYVYRAQLKDGSIVDLIRNGDPPSDVRPVTTAPMFWNHRWNKMHNTMALVDASDPNLDRIDRYRHQIAKYICNRWNDEHDSDKQVVKLDVLCFGTRIGPEVTPGEYSRQTYVTLTFAEPEEISSFQEELLRMENDEDPFSAKF